MDTKKVLAAVSLLAMVASPAFAFFPMFEGSDVKVENDNWAVVKNEVEAEAETGDNEIEGSRGGLIKTGDAMAFADVANTVNTNETKVTVPCMGCSGDVKVENDNWAVVKNEVEAEAETGDNEIESGSTQSCGFGCFGGFGGCTCPEIKTGDAQAWPTVINVVNTNITRIRR